MKEPVPRTASPYVDPRVKGPRSKILASGPWSPHLHLRRSECLLPNTPLFTADVALTGSRSVVISNSVNKTGLHPGGVQ